jgi:hypothetical protein
MGRISSAPWLLSLSLMWLGWGAATTTAGLVLLFAGTAWAVMLLLQERTPDALAWFTGIWTLDWVPAFAWQPWLLLVPACLFGLGWYRRWHQRRRLRAALAEFHRLDVGSSGDRSRREPGDAAD